MNEVQTRVEEHCSTEERERIVGVLVCYHDGHAGPEGYRDLVVVSRRGGELVGGLVV